MSTLYPLTMVTTEDNPFDYFDDFDNWYAFDTQKGYNTLSYLMREAEVDDEMPESLRNQEIERAVDEICFFNLTGNYKKVYEKESTSPGSPTN